MRLKRIEWVGNSLKELKSFSDAAQDDAGYELYKIQQGLEPKDWKPMSGIGPGVREIRIHVDNEYRIIYVAKFEEAIYVLHAFQKKSQQTPKLNFELSKTRFKELLRTRKQT